MAQSFTPDSDAAIYFNAIKTNGGTITLRQKVAVNNFVLAAKAHGYWTNITDCSPMAGQQTNAAIVKLVSHPQSQSTVLKVWGCDSTNYNPSIGFILNGAKYIWSGLVLSNQVIVGSNFFVGTWTNGQVTNTQSWLFGSATTGTHNYIYMWSGWTAADVAYEMKSEGGGSAGQAFTYNAGQYFAIDKGFCLMNRTDVSNVHVWYNGYPMITNTATITVQADYPRVFPFGARYDAAPPIGAPGTVSGNWIFSFYAVGTGLPDSAATNFYNDVMALQKDLGRLPPRSTRRPAIVIVGQSNAQGGTPTGNQTVYDNVQGGNKVNIGANAGTNYPTCRIQSPGGTNEWSAFAEELSYLSRTYGGGATTNDTLFETFAINGAGYGSLAKGTQPFYDSTNWAGLQNAIELANYNKTLRFPAMMVVHGENDSGSTNYGTNMVTWNTDYRTALNSFNSDSGNVPMFHSQIDSYTSGTKDLEYVNDQLLYNHEASGGVTNILACPKYQYPYADTLHLTATSYARLGEQYAWAFWNWIKNGVWDPVRPTSITETDTNQITCTFTGVVSQLVFDTNSVPWLNLTNFSTYGFSYTDASSPPTITNVVIQSSNQVVLTLNGTIHSKSGRKLSYAHNATNLTAACGTSGADGGVLRDSNTETGITTTSNLWNWAVHFQKTF